MSERPRSPGIVPDPAIDEMSVRRLGGDSEGEPMATQRAGEGEEDLDRSLRPPTLADFVAQEQVTEQLAIAITAARNRAPERPDEALDHILLSGPPGLGKTSLAHIVAAELGGGFVHTAAPALERKADVAAFLTSLEPNSVFFIDEIHRLNPAIEETLYPAMEDRLLPVVLGQGAGARTVNLDLPPFTLIGATTRAGRISKPLQDRFGMSYRLEHYGPEDLAQIIHRSARILGIEVEQAGEVAIASRARGTPRVANRLLRRVRDFAEVRGSGVVTGEVANDALELLDIDAAGLDRHDRVILETIAHKFSGGPVGLTTLSDAIDEEPDTIESVYEPYLIQQGLIKRTPRGRVLTEGGYGHLGVAVPEGAATLF